MKQRHDFSAYELLAPETLVAQAHKQMTAYHKMLSEKFGPLALTLAIACLGTSHPKITGFICILFVILHSPKVLSQFPEAIEYLRLKQDKSETEKTLLRGIEAEMLSWKYIRHSFLFVLGFLFLGYVAGGALGLKL